MSIVRRNQNWLPSIFNDFFDNEWMDRVNGYNNAITPAINVKENKNSYVVEVAAPGMTKEDFRVNIDEDDNLVVSMEKKNENREENKETRYLRHEFSYSKFQQAMMLPDDVEKNGVDAKVEHGVLYITLPKKAETVEKKSQRLIDIK